MKPITSLHHFTPQVKNLKPSATLRINEHSAELEKQGREIIRFGFGQSPFPVPDSVLRSLHEHAGEKAYLPVKGLPELRRAFAKYIERKTGLEANAEDVLIGPGSKELIFHLQMAHESVLLLPSPSWVSYEPQASLLNKPVHWINTRMENQWRLRAEDLEEACRAYPHINKLLILNYPNNPAGTTYPAAELVALAEVAKKYDLLILADEIYGDMHHEGRHVSIAHYYPEGTIISTGLSKWCGAGGWRLGAFYFPPRWRKMLEIMAIIASESFTSVSAPIQYAAVTAFLGNDDIDEYVKASRKILKTAARYVHRHLAKAGIPAAQPEGGFYLFPDFSPLRDRANGQAGRWQTSAAFCEYLLDKTGVALLPGSDFGRPETELTARLSYVDFDGERALEAARHVPVDEAFLEKYCPKVCRGTALIAEMAEG